MAKKFPFYLKFLLWIINKINEYRAQSVLSSAYQGSNISVCSISFIISVFENLLSFNSHYASTRFYGPDTLIVNIIVKVPVGPQHKIYIHVVLDSFLCAELTDFCSYDKICSLIFIITFTKLDLIRHCFSLFEFTSLYIASHLS